MKFEIGHHQSIAFPFAFEIAEDISSSLNHGLKNWPVFAMKKPCILFLVGRSGNSLKKSKKLIDQITASLQANCLIEQVKSASLESAQNIDALCAQRGVTTMIAIGGGTVIDVAKYVVKLRGTPLVVVPSVLSSDCIASPVSVLSDADGCRESLPSGIPSALLIDLSLTASAPASLTLSGVGDTLSNISALLDLDQFKAHYPDPPNGFSKILSQTAFELMLGLEGKRIDDFTAQRKIAMGLVLSGLAMSFAGNSLPCSGGEHLISHALDAGRVGQGTHGLQVALSTLYCLKLRKLLGFDSFQRDLKGLYKGLGLPTDPKEIGITREEFLRAVASAPETRRGRWSILSIDIPQELHVKAYEQAFSSED